MARDFQPDEEVDGSPLERAVLRARAARVRRQRTVACVIGVVAVLTVAAVTVFALGGSEGLAYDSTAREGQAPYKTDAEIQAELDRTVEEGMFDISIASMIEFSSPDALGTAYIENVPGNRYDMRVTITLEDGTEVYRSGALAPGTYVESIALDPAPDPGTYIATASFEALNRETHEVAGVAGAKVTLVVREGG